ncbi:hypothetical protein COCON_G00068030 [Conger conger]|uniref:XK-related protein n=1 Tax=Conger conger TaxID=82655 RepID=A0A9Q1I2E9_CONCO|nr:hypothetical protein COCON_G00068030 [Conger conger]
MSQALNRLMSLKCNFEKKHEMRDHFHAFMENFFKNGHAELAPPISGEEERWYLPTFGVYHPKKPKQIRVVFDSSAPYNGVSLNDVLLTGPDLNNTLLGVLMRYRKEAVAFSADIEQMFYSFLVREEDRNFLRFLWFQDNDFSKGIEEFRMKVHVFGNSPSPSVVIYGLHQSVLDRNLCTDSDVRHFVMRNFYVDDGLTSLPTAEAVITRLKKTQETLAKSNLRLHKIAANNREVMEAFPPEDRAADLKDLDLDADSLPAQRSLGLNWDLETDSFHFKVSDVVKPFTRRVPQIFSYAWFRDDGKIDKRKRTQLIFIHILQLGVFTRYFQLLKKGVGVIQSSEMTCHHEMFGMAADLTMLRLIETFVESAPQLLLQIYIILGPDQDHIMQYLSVAASFFSIAWATVEYRRSFRRSVPHVKEMPSGLPTAVYLSYKLFTIASHILSLSLLVMLDRIELYLVE